jgi:ornithine decarboxylase
MSLVEVLTAVNPIDHFISNHFPKYSRNSDTSYDPVVLPSSVDDVAAENQLDDEKIFSSLPPLSRGHPEIHLRKGIMDATRRVAENEADAERAFFVADLSQIFRQHERWVKFLPEIVPHYGLLPVHF